MRASRMSCIPKNSSGDCHSERGEELRRLVGQGHLHGASTRERVPTLGVVVAETGQGSEMAFLGNKLTRVILREP